MANKDTNSTDPAQQGDSPFDEEIIGGVTESEEEDDDFALDLDEDEEEEESEGGF